MRYGILCSGKAAAGVIMAEALGLEWGWINLFNLAMVVLLLVPNILYAAKRGGEKNLCESRLMNLAEQIGRYGSMLFMAVCFAEGGFGFHSVGALLSYCFGAPVLLLAYLIVWAVYFRMTGAHIFVKGDGSTAVFVAGRKAAGHVSAVKWLLVILPSCLFLLCGITLRYIPLIVSGVLFAVGHIYVTGENIKKNTQTADH